MKKGMALCLALLMLISVLPVSAMAATLAESASQTTEKADCVYYVIKPEEFEKTGGWKLDNTASAASYRDLFFYDQGEGNDPASTTLTVPHDGKYNIWVHGKDVANDRPGTRPTTVCVDGKELGKVANHKKEGWAWQQVLAELTGGLHELSFLNLKSWSRFDLVLVTDDLDYIPANTEAELKALEASHPYDPKNVKWTTVDPLAGRPDTEIAVKFNDEWLQFDVPPQLMNDRTMVPMRAIFEKLGCAVSWEDATQTATGVRNGKAVSVTIGSNIALVGGSMVSIDQSAALVNDRTLVPLRFVSEAFGAEVRWDDPSQTVFITADAVKAGYYIGGASYSDYGTWTMSGVNSDGSIYLVGTTPDSRPDGKPVTIDDADPDANKPAIAKINVDKPGKYKLWVRGRDFATNQQGTRFFNVAVNGKMDEKTFGQHKGEGFKWEEAGIYDLTAGENTVAVHDTSGFFARVAGILLCEDLEFVPSNNHVELSAIYPPLDPTEEVKAEYFPTWATADLPSAENTYIETDTTRVVFYTVSDGVHNFVQTEIQTKDASGNWVTTKAKTEEYGYMVLRADSSTVSDTIVNGNATVSSTFTHNGKTYTVNASNMFKMGLADWFVPSAWTKLSDNKVELSFPEQNGVTLKAVWEADGKSDPKVTVTANYVNAGNYSVIASNGREYTPTEYSEMTAPFRIVYKRVPEEPSVLIEQYMSAPMSVVTVPNGNGYISKGVAVDGSDLEAEWVYRQNSEFGFAVRGLKNGMQGGIMAPIMGSPYSKMNAGDSYSFSYRTVNTLEGWYETFTHVTKDIYDVHDYRSNYYNNLNDAIFNTTDLIMDDDYGGWDPIDLAQYNMEGQDLTTSANPLVMVQRYLLTEDAEIFDRRAIPNMAFALSRKSNRFKRLKTTGGTWAPYVANPPSEIGEPPVQFTGGTYGALYEMSKGGTPVFAGVAMEKEVGSGFDAIYNNLTYYRYTNDQKYLDAAKVAGDKYIESTFGNTNYMTKLRDWGSFINQSYFPNIGALIDLYEATGAQKYLDAAEKAGQILTTSLWATGIEDGKGDTPYTVTADYVYNVRGFMEAHNFWWHGSEQWRLGGDDGEARESKDGKVRLPESETVPGWLPTRVGLGLEQASTFSEALNIYMSSWAGDLTRLAYYTGDTYFSDCARNAIVGRFGNYAGYYQNRYMVHQMKERYPYEGPDYTSIYWHHIPPFLAMIEEFLITDFWYESGTKIEFPRIRQCGYAYFYSSQYGFDAGRMYDVDGLWLWNDRDVVVPDSVQIDYLAARKDGVLGISLMNRDKADLTTTVSLGAKVPGGAEYNGTATLYDASGNKSTVEVVNGKFTVNVPAKGIQTVMLNIDGVKAPSYAGGENRNGKAEIGATVSEHTRGRGYTLQLSGDNYYAYIYVTDMDGKNPDTEEFQYRANSMTVTYTVGGETKTVKRDEYPFEVLIQVDDVNEILTYEVQIEKADGTVENMGGGELMTIAKSNELGKKFDGTAIPGAIKKTEDGKPMLSAEAKAVYKEPFVISYLQQGTGSGAFRFVTQSKSIPFACKENLLAGFTATVEMTEKATGKVTVLESYVVGNEMRADGDVTVKIAPTPDWPLGDYDNDKAKTHTFKITLADKFLGTATPSVKEEAPKATVSGMEFDTFTVDSYYGQGSGNQLLRFVIKADKVPFACTADCLKGAVCVLKATENASGKVIESKTTLAGNEMRADGGITLLVKPTDEFPAGDYDNDKAKTHKFVLEISPAK